ncbi:hypothetical protein KRMM14A1004_56390 [Krasilnikovia sp. MM14-A1004]
MRLRRVVAGLIIPTLGAAALGGSPAPAAAASEPIPNPYSFTSDDVGFNGGGDRDGEVDRLSAIDQYVGDKKPIMRFGLDWNDIQPSRDATPDFRKLDRLVDAAHEQGIRVLLILGYSASWANGGRNPNYFPTEDAPWRAIVDATVTHFGDEVQAYEVWNEPNLKNFGNYGDNSVDVRARRYWELTRIAHERVKAHCSGCVVVAGGSAFGDGYTDAKNISHDDNEASDWLEWAYQHGYGREFDAVAYHPYPDMGAGHLPSYAEPPCTNGHWYRFWSLFGPDDVECGGLAALRDVLVRHGDSGKKIWATEFGVSTVGARVPVSNEQVRDALEEGVRMWRTRPGTGPLIIYSFQDLPPNHEACSVAQSECHFGLRDANGNPKEPMYTDVGEALRGDKWFASLSPGRSLFRGSGMRSNDGKFWLWMQGDGNLVMYEVKPGGNTVRWEISGRHAYRLSNQHDGNLVLYDNQNKALWASNTERHGDSTLWMQEDGNLVLYAHNPAPAKVTWASNTQQR